MSRGAADGGNGARLGLVSSLPTNERRVLAALAVVGQASLSADELAAVAEVDEVVSAIDDLRARGLLERADGERYSLVGSVGKEIRDTDAALATADRLSGYVMTLAKAGELTPERLVEETEAILGLTEWAAEHEEWRTVLELVKTVQSCFAIAHRIEAWIALLHRGRAAAHALHDRDDEVWALQQLATASASAGDPVAAERYLREADDVLRGRTSREPRERRPADESRRDDGIRRRTPGARKALWLAGVAAAGTAGLAAGLAIPSGGANIGTTTERVNVTIRLNGQPVTTTKLVTLPAQTVTTTITTTTTVTPSVG